MAKLVRDNIPQIMQATGKKFVGHVATGAEYWQKLKAKLVEEAAEFMRDETDAELADILEVINAICEFKKIDKENLEMVRKKKAQERGGFSKRLILDG